MSTETVSAPAPAADEAKPIHILKALNRALTDAMEADDKVIVLGEDVADPEEGGVVGVTRGLSTRFGDARCRSTPISEQAIIGAAIGASLAGYKPVAEIMLMNFVTVCMDMLVNHAAKLRFMSGGQTSVPIVVRTTTGVGFGSGGQHCDYLESWFAHTAGIKVVCPSNPADAYGLMRAAIDDPDPVLFIENLPSYWMKGPPPPPGHVVPLGKAHVVRQGTDLTIVSYSRMLNEALAAARTVAEQGVSAEVIDLRTVSPWDKATVLASVRKTGCLLVVHEAVKEFGVGAEIAATISKECFGALKAPVERLGATYAPVPFAKALEEAYTPNAARIADAVLSLVRS
ncbi:alpha-ketoacid dehydrogenase subunit beta [Sphingomonas sp. YL-JM2C]